MNKVKAQRWVNRGKVKSNRPKPPKFAKIAANSQSRSANYLTTDGDTTTDADGTSDGTRRKKVPTVTIPTVPTANQFHIDDNNSLSDYSEPASEIILQRPTTHKAKKMPPIVVANDEKQNAIAHIIKCVTSNNYSIRHMQVGMRTDIPNEIEHMATVAALNHNVSSTRTTHPTQS